MAVPNSARVGAGRTTRGACAATAACSGVMVWCIGAVSGESAAVRDDLLVIADCSLVLGRRSVFISLVLDFARSGGRRARLAPDDSTRAAPSGKVKDKRQKAKDKGKDEKKRGPRPSSWTRASPFSM